VARVAQVSISTVSRALNDGAEIHPDTREQIRRIALELGYVASNRGRGLVSGKTGNIGVLVGRAHLPVFLNPFYGEVLGGIEVELEARGLSLVLTSLKQGEALTAFAAEQRVDGLLIIGHDVPRPTLLQVREHLNVVLIDRYEPGLSAVTSEHRAACAQITRHLIRRGATRLAFLAEDLDNPNFHARYLGFQDALRDAGLPLRPDWVQAASPAEGGGYAAMRRILAAGGPPPDGVVGANDPVALEAVRAVQEAGLSVPGDVQVVGFDGLPPDRLHAMRLSTMTVDRQELGRQAARLLLDAPDTPRHAELQPTFVQGESSL
jgi:DNA-binding LacI/PurR family transcriptional regulator